MFKLSFVSAVLFVVGYWIQTHSPQSLFGVFEEIGLAGLIVSAFYYSYRLFGKIKRRLLWKVRNKIVVSYLIVGMIPVLFLAFIGWLSFRLLFGQVSALYFENQVEAVTSSLRTARQEVLLTYYAQRDRSLTQLASTLESGREQFIAAHPDLAQIEFYLFARSGSDSFRLHTAAVAGVESRVTIPAWIHEDFDGLVHDRGQLLFRSLSHVQAQQGALIAIQIPFDRNLVEHLERETAITLAPPPSVDPDSHSDASLSSIFRGDRGFLTINWMHDVAPVDWKTGSGMEVLDPELLRFAIAIPLDRLYYDFYFSRKTGLGERLLALMAVLGAIFVVAEGAALAIGVVIARTITRSVRDLYVGTQQIRGGNFDYRIASQRRDQLGDLAKAFNHMSDSIVGLMGQVSEKERLEKEIEIAHEVQTQLFPQVIPKIENAQLAGQCLPARRVSGDYYDFIPYGSKRVDIVVGDISGKGISAALLMASLQSAIRTHILYQVTKHLADESIAGAVFEINEHLYAHTAADKFATLVLARFHSDTRQLTYCSAGHNPPLLFSGDEVGKLTVGGMAAGLFEGQEYEEETIQLKPADVLVFYTDGVVEATDPQDEPFEEERLITLVQENTFLTADDIEKLILDEVEAWAQGGEQHDDITVVVLKLTAPPASVTGPAGRSPR